jgi:hypothetical protein
MKHMLALVVLALVSVSQAFAQQYVYPAKGVLKARAIRSSDEIGIW